MTRLTVSSILPVPPGDAFDWHLRDGAFERLTPPWDRTIVSERSGSIEDETLVVRLETPILGPIRQVLVAEHDGFVPGHRFRDTLVRGPFASWAHEHLVFPLAGDPTRSLLVDDMRFTLPLEPFSRPAEWVGVRPRLRKMFGARHATCVGDLAAHAAAGLAPGITVQVHGHHGALRAQLEAYLSTGGATIADDESSGTGEADATVTIAAGTIRVAPAGGGGDVMLEHPTIVDPRLGTRLRQAGPERAWISLDDLLGAIEWAIVGHLAAGTVSVAAPGTAGADPLARSGYRWRSPTREHLRGLLRGAIPDRTVLSWNLPEDADLPALAEGR